MIKITIDEFINQWVSGGSARLTQSRFQSNIFEFTTIAGNYSKRYFTTSFISGGFYGSGTTWKPRQSRWGKKFTHPVMLDTGKLRGGIKGEGKSISINGRRDDGRILRRYGARYSIWTSEKSTPVKGKRGKSKNRHGHYAAVHNTDPRFGLYTVNQYSNRAPEHRQFIGLSKKLDLDIERFIPIILRGFPH